MLLKRIEAGHNIPWNLAEPLVTAKLAEAVSGPSSGSGYRLTKLGSEALTRDGSTDQNNRPEEER